MCCIPSFTTCDHSFCHNTQPAASPATRLKNHLPSPPFGSLTKRARSLPPHFNMLKCSILHNLRHRFLVPPRPHADGGGVYRLFTGILRFSQAVRGPVVGLTKALRPRLHRRCFVLPRRLLLLTASFVACHSGHAFLPDPMTVSSAASRSRPIHGVSSPDIGLGAGPG